MNVADMARTRGNEEVAEHSIRDALACAPGNAAAHHALGLWLVRNARTKEALLSLRRATELAPTDVRFQYVLAVAIADQGQQGGVIARVLTLGNPRLARSSKHLVCSSTNVLSHDCAGNADSRLEP